MNPTDLVRAPWRLVRRLRRRQGLARTLFEVGAVTLLVFSLSGFVRGTGPDELASRFVHWLRTTAHEILASGWVKPVVADGVVLTLTYVCFAALLIGMAALFRRIPAFIGYLVLCEFHRRQGHNLSALELLLGLSLPIALTLALTCKSAMSLFACTHVALSYAYVRASNDPRRMDTILNWYVRIRTASDNSVSDDAEADSDED